MPAYQLWADDFWNVWKALVVEHLLDVFPALRQSLWTQIYGLFVIILQLKEPHSHASNACNVRTFVS